MRRRRRLAMLCRRTSTRRSRSHACVESTSELDFDGDDVASMAWLEIRFPHRSITPAAPGATSTRPPPAQRRASSSSKAARCRARSAGRRRSTRRGAGQVLCGNQNFYGASVLNLRVDLHAIDATPARWRGDAESSPLDRASTATSSPRNDCTRHTG